VVLIDQAPSQLDVRDGRRTCVDVILADVQSVIDVAKEGHGVRITRPRWHRAG
jgi:hypothetical protein